MIKLAICDDDDNFLNELRNFIAYKFSDSVHKIDTFHDGIELLNYINDYDEVYDFILLDIGMNILSGIETGKALRKMPEHQHSLIFFITSYNINPRPIVDIHPFAYINKPVNYDDFSLVFSEALVLHNDEKNIICIQSGKNSYLVHPIEIYYLESIYRSTILHLVNGELTIKLPLSKIEKILSKKSKLFARINSSTIINLKYLSISKPSEVILNDKDLTHHSLSRTYHKTFFQKCNDVLFH